MEINEHKRKQNKRKDTTRSEQKIHNRRQNNTKGTYNREMNKNIREKEMQ